MPPLPLCEKGFFIELIASFNWLAGIRLSLFKRSAGELEEAIRWIDTFLQYAKGHGDVAGEQRRIMYADH